MGCLAPVRRGGPHEKGLTTPQLVGDCLGSPYFVPVGYRTKPRRYERRIASSILAGNASCFSACRPTVGRTLDRRVIVVQIHAGGPSLSDDDVAVA